MKLMKYLGLLMTGVVIAGCGRVESTSQNRPARRLKIGDLAPGDPVEFPKQVSFQIATLEISTDHIDVLQDAIQKLHSEPLHFASLHAFENSGLTAGFGQSTDWHKFTVKMDEAKPRQVYVNTLVCLDEKGLDMASGQLYESQTVIYKDAGQSFQEVTLEPGQVAWSIRSRPIPDMPGVADTTIQAVHRRRTDITAARLSRTVDVKQTVLGPTTLSVKIGSGQFLVLAPNRIDEQPESLVNLLFPNPRDADVIRFYLILCSKVGR